MKKWYMTCCLLTAMTLAWAQGPNNTGTYYKNANGERGEALKTALSAIITKGHTKIGYDGLYNAYKKTDSRPDGKVRDWYSNATNYTHVTDKAGSYKKEGDCYNREHSLPQSWFEGGGNADYLKCDIVHVLPTDGYINNQRSNNVLANVNPSRISGQSKNGYSKWGQCGVSGYSGTVFEPNDDIKGDMARIYFYVVTRYESNCTKWASNATANAVFTSSSSYQPFKDWYYKMLVEWSQNDPVDELEIARNNAVYSEQGNRNPFVDYPGLEEYVWGDKKNEPFDYANYNATVAVRTPTFSPDGGTFASPQSVTISCATDGATIYYTIDGTTPTASSTPYTEPITVSESLTLMAIAVKDDEQSSVATASFVIKDEGDDPTPTGDNIYKKVTSTSDLESGKRYLIVYEEGGKALLRLDGKA
ncbi:MAG: endonuclease, partial [Prevotella sp.]|nr:endonuclease [Prevotella sp.]